MDNKLDYVFGLGKTIGATDFARFLMLEMHGDESSKLYDKLRFYLEQEGL